MIPACRTKPNQTAPLAPYHTATHQPAPDHTAPSNTNLDRPAPHKSPKLCTATHHAVARGIASQSTPNGQHATKLQTTAPFNAVPIAPCHTAPPRPRPQSRVRHVTTPQCSTPHRTGPHRTAQNRTTPHHAEARGALAYGAASHRDAPHATLILQHRNPWHLNASHLRAPHLATSHDNPACLSPSN